MALEHWRTSPTGERKHECRDRHVNCCENRCDGDALFAEECLNSLGQRLVFMEEPPDGLTDPTDLGPERCLVRGDGFEPCLSLELDVGEVALQLFHSVSNLFLNFGVVRFRQFSALSGQVLLNLALPVVGI